MTIQPQAIGRCLKSIRTQRDMTLEDVAKATGVSKPMLGQIERGQSTPTITTLNKIATGLKVPATTFLKEEEADYTIADVQHKNLIEEDNGLTRACTLFPFDPLRNTELFYIEFDSGCHYESNPHLSGTEEYLLVLRGKLDLTIGEKQVTLHKQQAIRFKADLPHVYANPYGENCAAYNMIFYSEI